MTTSSIYKQFPVLILVGYTGKVDDGAQDHAWSMIVLESISKHLAGKEAAVAADVIV